MVATANEESEKLLRSLPDLPEADRQRIAMMYERFAKKMANDYLYKVKAENAPEDVKVFLKCLEGGHV
jgi:glutamyl-tRNA reductase